MRFTRHKYGAVKTVASDGKTFPSKKEAARYEELRLLQLAHKIHGLECHPKFDLLVNGKMVGRYTADFQYLETVDASGAPQLQFVVEEVKGYRVRDYALRKALFKALFPDVIHREI